MAMKPKTALKDAKVEVACEWETAREAVSMAAHDGEQNQCDRHKRRYGCADGEDTPTHNVADEPQDIPD